MATVRQGAFRSQGIAERGIEVQEDEQVSPLVTEKAAYKSSLSPPKSREVGANTCRGDSNCSTLMNSKHTNLLTIYDWFERRTWRSSEISGGATIAHGNKCIDSGVPLLIVTSDARHLRYLSYAHSSIDGTGVWIDHRWIHTDVLSLRLSIWQPWPVHSL